MKFPKLPYMTGNKRIRHENPVTIAFRGLNLTNATQDGEFADTLGLSTTDYPFLTQIKGRNAVTGYTSPTDIYVWDGHLYVVDGTSLKKDGVSIGTVTAGQKQMAVINTKLVIYPDKKVVDMTTDTVSSLVTKNETYSTYTITTSSIQATGIATAFADGDVVDVTGTGVSGKRIVVQEVDTDTDTITFVDDAITLGTYSGDIVVQTSVPELDFICSSNNRIWGVCNADNTVYASALGDPTSFFDYTSESGSYSLAIGSDGDFTGICSYGGAVLVWKEDILHKILGSYPSEYYMVDYPVFGVQKGSEKSLVVINNILYYKGVFGVYQYGGNTPQNISANLGTGIYKYGVAGTDGRKYYINMQDPAGNYHLYAYDLMHGFWMKEEDGQMVAITNMDQDVFFIKSSVLYRTNGSVKTDAKAATPGNIVEFDDGVSMPISSAVISLVPRQDIGNGYPSPTNVCPITGHTGVTLYTANKNLFIATFTSGKNINTGVIENKAGRSATIDACRINPSTQYTISYTGGGSVGVYYYDEHDSYLSMETGWASSPRTFTTPAGAAFVRFSYNSASLPIYVQLEAGETATAYESSRTSYPFTFSSPSTVYGGTYNFVTGKLIVTYKGVLGSELTWEWFVHASGDVPYFDVPDKKKGRTNYYCSAYKVTDKAWTTLTSGETVETDTLKRIVVRNTAWTTLEEAEADLADVQFVYELDTPLEYTLTPQEALTLFGHNLVWTDAGSITSLNYEVFSEWYGELVETTEDMLSRKGYVKLLVRLDMMPGSTMEIYAKEDRRAYRKIWEENRGAPGSVDPVTLLVPIRLGRCDRWQLKLVGTGEVTVRAIGREHVTGSVK